MYFSDETSGLVQAMTYREVDQHLHSRLTYRAMQVELIDKAIVEVHEVGGTKEIDAS